jgi:hypothetical protein
MTTIDATRRLAVMLRREVAAFRQASRASPPAARSAPAGADVASVAARRIHGIAADDPRRGDKAVRIFLESVFLQELGAGLVHDPAFARMVEAVHRQMREDAELAASLDALSGVLLQAASGRRPR